MNNVTEKESGRLLFTVVRFENSLCTPVNAAAGSNVMDQGTCLNADECMTRNGTNVGHCASGFGVCCMITLMNTNGGTVTQNCSFIANNGFPATISNLSQNAVYNINPINNDICEYRLDFITFQLNPATTAQITGPPMLEMGTCLDTFTVAGQAGRTPPVICGTNSGQHMYIENARSTAATVLTFALSSSAGGFAVSMANAGRSWRVRVCQLECTNMNRPPSDCTQYFTASSGTFSSYNFDGTSGLPENQNYATCIRRNAGMCSINYSVAPAPATSMAVAFQLDTGTGSRISECTLAYINIPSTGGTGMFCGVKLNPIVDQTVDAVVTSTQPPFIVNLRSAMADATNILGKGYSLQYSQAPC